MSQRRVVNTVVCATSWAGGLNVRLSEMRPTSIGVQGPIGPKIRGFTLGICLVTVNSRNVVAPSSCINAHALLLNMLSSTGHSATKWGKTHIAVSLYGMKNVFCKRWQFELNI